MSVKYFVSSTGGARDPDKLLSVVCLLDVTFPVKQFPAFNSFPGKNISKSTFIRSYQKLSCKNLTFISAKTPTNKKSFLLLRSDEADSWPAHNLTIYVKLIIFYSLLINFDLYIGCSGRIVVHYKNDTK